MKEEDFRRLGGLAGGAVFIMALLLLLLKATPFNALLGALAAGIASGVAVYLVGAIVAIGREPAVPVPPPVETQASSSPDETRIFSPQDVTGTGLDQTVRLEPGTLEYILPEMSPEQILKEREGLDIGVLEQGLEASQKASETLVKGEGEGGT